MANHWNMALHGLARLNRQMAARPAQPLQARASNGIGARTLTAAQADSGDAMRLNAAATGEENPSPVSNTSQQPAGSGRLTGELSDTAGASSSSSTSSVDDQSPPQPLPQPRRIPPMPNIPDSDQMPPEMTQWLDTAHEILDRRILELEAHMYHERRSMTRDLRAAREALLEARRERADAEQNVLQLEAYIMTLERRHDRRQDDQKDELISTLRQQVTDLEEQLEIVYQINPPRPNRSAQNNSSQQGQQTNPAMVPVNSHVQNLEEEIKKLQGDLNQATARINTLCTDLRLANQKNLQNEIFVHASRRAARRLVEILLLTPFARNNDITQLMTLMNVADHDLVLDRVLLAIGRILNPQ